MSEHPEQMASMPPPGAPAAPPPPKEKNTLGLVALIIGIIGFVFACIPGALIIGWILLPIAFILGIAGLFASGKTKGTSIAAVIIAVVGTVVGFIVFATVITDAVDDAFGGSDLSPSAPAATDPRAGVENADDEAAGTRDNPLRVGQPVSNPDWNITLGAPREAWQEIHAENEFNDPPPDGMEYWIVPVTATYTGEDTANPGVDITVQFVGSDNRTYDDYCGVIPDTLDDIGDLYAGGQAEGNTCVTVPAGADGLWTLATGFTGKPIFFAAQ